MSALTGMTHGARRRAARVRAWTDRDPKSLTREGARAAWGFVIDAPFGIEAAVPLMRAWNIRAAAMAEFAQVVGAKYRRELEAI